MSSQINLGLERIRALLSHLPAYTRPTVHVAGTNGKGSVTALLSSILKTSSYRVGRFNSPHLVSVLDSITIDDVPVSQARYDAIRQRVERADNEHNVGASSFELLTATALMVFEDARVDVAVVEVGMGGRLDATNVVPDECILVSALTAVDLDHQSFLGDTVEQIAAEKAAIARKGKPLVLGPQVHPEVASVARNVVEKAGGTLIAASVPRTRDWEPSIDGNKPADNLLSASAFTDIPQPVSIRLPPFSSPLDLLLPLRGDHQLANLGTALTVISALLAQADLSLRLKENITSEALTIGIMETRWPGRLSFHTVSLPIPSSGLDTSSPVPSKYLVLADGAHNPASSSTLSSFITDLLSQRFTSSKTPPPTLTLTYVLALSHSPPKMPRQTLSPLFATLNEFLSSKVPKGTTINVRVGLLKFTPPEGMPWVRAEPPAELRDVVASLIPDAETWAVADEGLEPVENLKKALNWAVEGQFSECDEAREGLIVVAGSLYLVADFYRLLEAQENEET